MYYHCFIAFFNHCAIMQIVKLWHLIGMPVCRIGIEVTKSQFACLEKEMADLSVF